ncbi:MAG: GatB/YqeY domain-containing protein [Patescibacteria group bacterium]
MFKEKLNVELKEFLKNKDTEKVTLLRMILSAFQNEAIAKKKQEEGLNEEEEIQILKREVKKRKDSIEQYTSGGRQDLADKEKQELDFIQKYLPEEMSEEEIKKIVEEVITSMGEVAPSQFGQIMSQVMAKTKGQADGNLVSKIVREMVK